MTDIVEFLTARLDEDEALAGLATPPPWRVETAPHRTNVVVPEVGIDRVGTAGRRLDLPPVFTGQTASCSRVRWEADANHIARHDPARVLREVAAKREVVELHTTGVIRTYKCSNGDHIQEWQCKRAQEPYTEDRYCEICGNECVELPVLAAVYADHPDYDPAWRVS